MVGMDYQKYVDQQNGWHTDLSTCHMDNEDSYHTLYTYPKSGKMVFTKAIESCTKGSLFGTHVIGVLGHHPLKFRPSFWILRHPIYAAISYWEWTFNYEGVDAAREYNGEDPYHPSLETKFNTFVWEKVIEWFRQYMIAKRVYKWDMVIKYEDLIFRPKTTVIEALRILGVKPIGNSIHGLGEDDTQAHNPSMKYKPRNLFDCPFYNRKEFAQLWCYVNDSLDIYLTGI